MPSTSPSCTSKRDVVEHGLLAGPSTVRPCDAQPDLGRRRRSCGRAGDGSSLPTISSASCERVTSAGFTSATVVPARMTVMSSETASTSSSLCEMKMIGGAVGDEAVEVGEQLVDLLRHEHGGGLVEDEDAGAAVEHLQDLDPLALADAEVGHGRVEVDVRARRACMSSCEVARGPRRTG